MCQRHAVRHCLHMLIATGHYPNYFCQAGEVNMASRRGWLAVSCCRGRARFLYSLVAALWVSVSYRRTCLKSPPIPGVVFRRPCPFSLSWQPPDLKDHLILRSLYTGYTLWCIASKWLVLAPERLKYLIILLGITDLHWIVGKQQCDVRSFRNPKANKSHHFIPIVTSKFPVVNAVQGDCEIVGEFSLIRSRTKSTHWMYRLHLAISNTWYPQRQMKIKKKTIFHVELHFIKNVAFIITWQMKATYGSVTTPAFL